VVLLRHHEELHADDSDRKQKLVEENGVVKLVDFVAILEEKVLVSTRLLRLSLNSFWLWICVVCVFSILQDSILWARSLNWTMTGTLIAQNNASEP
jgi:hypothetical protein